MEINFCQIADNSTNLIFVGIKKPDSWIKTLTVGEKVLVFIFSKLVLYAVNETSNAISAIRMVIFTCVGTTKEISMPLYNTGTHNVQRLLWQ